MEANTSSAQSKREERIEELFFLIRKATHNVVIIIFIGIAIALISVLLNNIFSREANSVFYYTGIIGGFLILMPIFILQLALPLSMFNSDLSFYKKVFVYAVSYLIILPIINIFMALLVNKIFPFLPDFFGAIEQGLDAFEVQKMRYEAIVILKKIGYITTACMLTIALLIKNLFTSNLEKDF